VVIGLDHELVLLRGTSATTDAEGVTTETEGETPFGGYHALLTARQVLLAAQNGVVATSVVQVAYSDPVEFADGDRMRSEVRGLEGVWALRSVEPHPVVRRTLWDRVQH